MMKKIICLMLVFMMTVVYLNAQNMPADMKSCNEILAYANDVYQQIKTIKDDVTKSMDDEIAAATGAYQRKVTAILREPNEAPTDFEERRRSEKAEYAATLEEELNNIRQRSAAFIEEKTAELQAKLTPFSNPNLSLPGSLVRVVFTQYDPKTQRYNYIIADGEDRDLFYEWYIDVTAKDPNVQKELLQKIKKYVGAKGYAGYMTFGIIWDENESKFVKKLKTAGVKQKDTGEIVSKINVQMCFPRSNTMFGHGYLCQVNEFDRVMTNLVKQAAPDKPFNIRISDSKPNLTAIAASLVSKPTVMVNLDLSHCDTTDSTADKPFEQCTNLVGVATPLFVSDGLFDGCGSLKNILFPEGVTKIGNKSFFRCAGLTEVTLPETLTSIGDAAFGGCVGLTSMTLPDSVTSVGEGAFIGCFGLTEPIYNANVFAYLSPTFEGEYSIPNGIREVAGSSFYNCKGLTNVVIPKSVRNIGNKAFEHCEKLTKPVFNSYVFAYMPASYKGAYTIQKGVKIIAGGAFANCADLSAINLPNSLMTIGDGAFYGCGELTNVIIPNSLLYICDDAFRDCDELLTVKIGLYVKSIGKGAFAECAKLLTVALPDSVTSIGDEVFFDCPNLRDVTIPNGVHHIGKKSFYKCIGMTNITIGNDVVSIGESAFSYCSSLPDVIIPNSVQDIGDGIFSNCEKLKTLLVHVIDPPLAGENILENCPSFTGIFVPMATVKEYKEAPNWSTYADKIVAGDF